MQSAPSLLAMRKPGMIHQNLANQLGGNAQKVRPVLPVHLRLVHQSKISLVDQGVRLKGVAASLPLHVVVGDAAQFSFHEGDQVVETLPLTRSPAEEQLGY